MNNNTNYEVSLDTIQKWLADADWRIRFWAMEACAGR